MRKGRLRLDQACLWSGDIGGFILSRSSLMILFFAHESYFKPRESKMCSTATIHPTPHRQKFFINMPIR